MFSIIFWGSLFLVVLCHFFAQKSEAKFRKNIVLGVTLPARAHDCAEVAALLNAFKRKNKILFGILGTACIAGFFIPDLSVSLIFWGVVFLAVLAFPQMLFVSCNRKLAALKQARGWTCADAKQVRVDLSAMISYPKPKPAAYLFPALLCIVSMLMQPALWWVHALFLLTVLFSCCAAVFLYRKKSETVDANTQLTQTLSALRYRMWKYIWCITALCSALASLSLAVLTLSFTVGITLMLVSSFGCCAAVVMIELHTRRMQEKLTAESGTEWYVDEDDYWLGGLFYYNPNDSHIMANMRTGTGSTFNLATKTGKFVTAVSLVLALLIPVFLVSLAVDEKSEILLDPRGQSVLCESGSTRYEVSFDEIEQLELLETMPEGLFRTNALGGQHIFKGSFAGGGMSDLKIIADPTVPPYLKIKTASGRYYLFGTRNPDETRSIFAELSVLIAPADGMRENPAG